MRTSLQFPWLCKSQPAHTLYKRKSREQSSISRLQEQTQDEKMKAEVCAILLLLTVYQGHTLQCNYCFSKGGDLCTPTSIQTCSRSADACGAVILSYPVNSSFRQCMNMAVCQGYIKTPGAFAQCCSTDLCN